MRPVYTRGNESIPYPGVSCHAEPPPLQNRRRRQASGRRAARNRAVGAGLRAAGGRRGAGLKPMAEFFVPVATEPGIPGCSCLDTVVDSIDGLTIVLRAPDASGSRIELIFPRRLALRITDEGDRLRSMDVFDGRAATPLGVIENSRWVDWLVAESLDIRAHESLKHWCIVTPDDIVEVIAHDPPTVSIVAALQ